MAEPDLGAIESVYNLYLAGEFPPEHPASFIPALIARVRELEVQLAQKVCRHEWLRREGEEVRCQHCRALMVKSDMGPYVAASEIEAGVDLQGYDGTAGLPWDTGRIEAPTRGSGTSGQ